MISAACVNSPFVSILGIFMHFRSLVCNEASGIPCLQATNSRWWLRLHWHSRSKNTCRRAVMKETSRELHQSFNQFGKCLRLSEVMMRTAFARKILFRFVPWDMQRWHVIVWKWSWRALDCRCWAQIFRREGHGGKFRTMFAGCHVVHPFKCVVKSQACFLHVAQCLDKSLCTWFRIRNIIPTSEDVWWVASSCKWHAWRVRNVPLTACCVRVRKWSCIPPRHWDIDLNGWSSMSCRCPPSSSSRQAESLDVGVLFSNLST